MMPILRKPAFSSVASRQREAKREAEDRGQKTESGGRRAQGRGRGTDGLFAAIKEAAGAGGEVGEGAAEGDVLGDGGLKSAVTSKKIRVPL